MFFMAETVKFKNITKKLKTKNLYKCKKSVKCVLLASKLYSKPTHFSFIIFSIKKIFLTYYQNKIYYYNHSENQMSAIKNDKTEANQGLQNIQG